MARTTIYLSDAVKERLDLLATINRRSRTRQILYMLERQLDLELKAQSDPKTILQQ